MIKLVLVRHGQSTWNKENRFTGWTDVELTEQGIKEAKEAGIVLREKGFTFDLAFTSVLVRATDTLKYILQELNEETIPVKYNWQLNERHYGALQGLNKDETKLKYGTEQVQLWRRSTKETPPALTVDDSRYPGNDPKYKDLKESELPLTENLSDTIKRVLVCWHNQIKPELELNKKIIIVAHGNSLRALIKYLDNMSDDEITELELETGNPICYELDDNLKSIRHYYLKENRGTYENHSIIY
ncbi:MAG: 2,3-diphosphoglycerate-dependent phosphoglycerate mutase [Bacilli bacterium]